MPKWITEKGKLTSIFEKALDRDFSKGGVVAAMNDANCKKVGNWMVDHVSSWSEKGKNPKTEGRMMISVLARPTKAAHKADINACAKIVGKELSSLPATNRK